MTVMPLQGRLMGGNLQPPPAAPLQQSRACRAPVRIMTHGPTRAEAPGQGTRGREASPAEQPEGLLGRLGLFNFTKPVEPSQQTASNALPLPLDRRQPRQPRALERIKAAAQEAAAATQQSSRSGGSDGSAPRDVRRLAAMLAAVEKELEATVRAARTQGTGEYLAAALAQQRLPQLLSPDRQVPMVVPPALLEGEVRPEGTGQEVLLQGFNWESHKVPWYEHIAGQADWIADLGFTAVWLPPPTESVSPQGYMPRDLYCLDSQYGSEQQLKSCVARLQQAGLKVLGDAVLNHRCAHFQDSAGVWNQFGGRLEWDATAIVGDDKTFRGAGGPSTGEIFPAAPNIDHGQEFVRRDITQWLQWLRVHVGFDGWRLDFVRGFSGEAVREYMEASRPQFAVGEFWDSLAYGWDGVPEANQDRHRQRIVSWLNAAGGTATAFDVTTKGILHAVFERCEYWRLRDDEGKAPGVMGWWPSRATTFLENHDTGSTQGHWRFPNPALEQGYAYLLTHPGTPCIFYDHIIGEAHLQATLRRLIALRRAVGIHCRSELNILKAERDVYVAEIDSKLLMKIGPGDFAPEVSDWRTAETGNCWAVWERCP